MRINNNVTAMNTHRMYTNNNNSVTKSVAKLSSGYRINSAGDDAAGLAISEKMRAQIRGLTMASKNSQDAISLVQTAEGALQETHNILQRMRELAVQSGSDTNETSIDRAALDAEFQELKKEIDDIASKTRFNDQNLIDGTFSSYKYSAAVDETGSAINNVLIGDAKAGTYALTSVVRTVGAEVGAAATFSTNTETAANVASATFEAGDLATANTEMFNKDFTLKFKELDSTNNIAYFEIEAADGTKFTGSVSLASGGGVSAATGGGSEIKIVFGDVGTLTLTTNSALSTSGAAYTLGTEAQIAENFEGVVLTGRGGAADVAGTTKAYLKLGEEEMEVFAGDKEVEFRSAGVTVVLNKALTSLDLFGSDGSNTEIMIGAASTAGSGTAIDADIEITQTKGKSMVIQTGANEGDNLAINISKMNTNFLGIYTSSIDSREKASNAISYVNAAVNKVSTQRAALGALQNRMEHKIANLDTSAENLTAAESRIRDVDMASEMTNFTKANILAQASTAMLAQANALPQNVLQLLG